MEIWYLSKIFLGAFSQMIQNCEKIIVKELLIEIYFQGILYPEHKNGFILLKYLFYRVMVEYHYAGQTIFPSEVSGQKESCSFYTNDVCFED